MSDRLSREEIERDEAAIALEKSASFMQKHAKTLVLVVVAALVMTAVILGVNWWLSIQGAKANAALTEALEVYRAPVGAAAAQGAEPDEAFADEAARRARASELFQAVRDDFGMTDAADVADVYLAQIAAETGDLDRARELWRGFVDAHDDHVLAGQVRVNLIHLDRQQGQAQAVVERLEPMLEAAPDERELPADVVLWELAQTYEELDRGDEAEATYRRLAEEYPTSAYAAQARQRLPQEGPQGGGLPGGALQAGGGFPGAP